MPRLVTTVPVISGCRCAAGHGGNGKGGRGKGEGGGNGRGKWRNRQRPRIGRPPSAYSAVPSAFPLPPSPFIMSLMPKRSNYQDRVIRNYYQNRDKIMLQRLGELVTDLYLAEGKARAQLWNRVAEILDKLKVPKDQVQHLVQSDNPTLVAERAEKVAGAVVANHALHRGDEPEGRGGQDDHRRETQRRDSLHVRRRHALGGRGGPGPGDILRQRPRPANPRAEARLFQTRIRRNVRLAEAPSFGKSIFQYAPDSHGAEDYRSWRRKSSATAREASAR